MEKTTTKSFLRGNLTKNIVTKVKFFEFFKPVNKARNFSLDIIET